MKLLVLNGPNINMLGIREPAVYGNRSYEDLQNLIREHAKDIGADVEFFQSNHEGALIDEIQKAYFDKVDGIIFNPAGYTHTSVAIADAVKAVGIPTIEVHISDVDQRESFRKISFVGNVVLATIKGHGFNGYLEAMDMLKNRLQQL